MSGQTPLWAWIAVTAAIGCFLALDIKTHAVRPPTLAWAIIASAAWIGVSVLFGVILWVTQGGAVAEQYFGAYLLEKSLSIDNVFVFVVLFGAFAVPRALQHRVLYYGVVGALVLRALFITVGANLLDSFSWVRYVFGAIVVLAGLRMARGAETVNPERNLLVRGVRRIVPVTADYRGDRFTVREAGRRIATPLLVVLVAIESSDIVFATDSIPAVFGVTDDVFVVFTSNAFAVLGLRALYFVFADLVDRFSYLKYGLAVLLVFVGVKLLLVGVVEVPILFTLGVIALVIGVSVTASVLATGRRAP